MTDKPFKWAFISDLQAPYHDRRAVALWFKVMKKWKPDAIDIPGDIDDQLEYSRFSDGTTDEFFNQLKVKEKDFVKENVAATKAYDKLETDEEREAFEFPESPNLNPLPFIKENAAVAKEFYTDVRKQHPDADIHACLGNHDIRIFEYIDKKAPDHKDAVTPNLLWGLEDLGISYSYYDEPPIERYGGIHVHHGNTTSSSGLAVKGDIENFGVSMARGHDHRGGVVYKSYPMTGTTLVGLGTGHMCDPHAYGLRYTNNATWELGFGIGHVVEGAAQLQFIPISRDYTCVVDGVIFKG